MASIRVAGADTLAKQLRKELSKELDKLKQEVYATAQKNTPIKTGRARKGWRKRDTNTGFSVENKVPYIGRLEAGASKQAPNGIINPTIATITGRKR